MFRCALGKPSSMFVTFMFSINGGEDILLRVSGIKLFVKFTKIIKFHTFKKKLAIICM